MKHLNIYLRDFELVLDTLGVFVGLNEWTCGLNTGNRNVVVNLP